MAKNVGSAFTASDVSKITGISVRRLAYWDDIGLVRPSLKAASGKGSRRLYSLHDLVELTIVAELLDGKLPLQRIRKSFSCIRSLSIPFSELVIVSNSETVYACKSNDFVVDTLRHGRTVLKLVVADLLKEVEEQVAALSLTGGLRSEQIDLVTAPMRG